MKEMTVRKLEPQEYYDADTISRICFHERFDGVEAEERAKLHLQREDWGAFDEDGKLKAHIINNHFWASLNGSTVSMGGIGAVSTLPEYRDSGAIRQIFAKLLPEAYQRGEIISALYPFKHAFYRKFGYETVASCTCYVLKPAMLRNALSAASIEQYQAGQDVKAYTDLHNRFAQRYNLSIIRDENAMKHFLCDKPLAERRFSYKFRSGSRDHAYLCFTDQREEPAAKFVVNDIAWDEPLQLNGILGFLGRFEADYGDIELILPTDMNLKLLLADPYEIKEAKMTGHYMLRAVNVREALKTFCPEARDSFTVAVYGDEQISQNNGAWRVSADGVTDYTGTPDIEAGLNAFNQILCGALSLDQALYRGDVKVNAKAGTLTEIFRSRPIFVTDRF